MNNMFEENLIETREKKHKKTKILSIVCIILSIFYPIILFIFSIILGIVLDFIESSIDIEPITITYKPFNICIVSGYIIILLILVVNLLNYYPKTSEESLIRKKVRKFNIIAIIILMLSCIGWGYYGYSKYYEYQHRPQDIICFPKEEVKEEDILYKPLNQEDKTND